jgi:ABC-type Fe3+ transport system permease subunit
MYLTKIKLSKYHKGGEKNMKLTKALVALSLAGFLAMPTLALAQGLDQDVQPFQGTSGGTTVTDLVASIITIVNALLALVAIIAVVFVVIGGVRYITSQGDEDAVAAAKNTIIYAIVGLVVIILSAVLINVFLGLF